jgi:hypothetical protein
VCRNALTLANFKVNASSSGPQTGPPTPLPAIDKEMLMKFSASINKIKLWYKTHGCPHELELWSNLQRTFLKTVLHDHKNNGSRVSYTELSVKGFLRRAAAQAAEASNADKT